MGDGSAKLIICPTPLGNLGDMTQRAVEALRSADVVCCEDTRVTGRLLAALGIEGVRLERLDEALLGRRADAHAPENPASEAGALTFAHATVERVRAGETIAYCSDAGMPGVSDPGQRLVAAAREAGVAVEVLPGPSAAVTAYVASGFTCPRFYFGGFFPRKAGERIRVLEVIEGLDAVSIFYESPHRIAEALQAVAQVLPERTVAVCRELTKMHEEVAIGPAPRMAYDFAARAEEGIRGEIAFVVDAPARSECEQRQHEALEQAAEKAQHLLAQGTLSKKDIVAQLQNEFSISRNAAYELVHGR